MDDAVDPPESGFGAGDGLLHLPPIGHVCLEHEHLGAESLDGLQLPDPAARGVRLAVPLQPGAPLLPGRQPGAADEHQPGLHRLRQECREREADAPESTRDQVDAPLPQASSSAPALQAEGLEGLYPALAAAIGDDGLGGPIARLGQQPVDLVVPPGARLHEAVPHSASARSA